MKEVTAAEGFLALSLKNSLSDCVGFPVSRINRYLSGGKQFPPQVDGDLVKDGVCGLLIARNLRVSQPTASEHLKILTAASLIRGKRIKQWTFYKRDEAQIKRLKKLMQSL